MTPELLMSLGFGILGVLYLMLWWQAFKDLRDTIAGVVGMALVTGVLLIIGGCAWHEENKKAKAKPEAPTEERQ